MIIEIFKDTLIIKNKIKCDSYIPQYHQQKFNVVLPQRIKHIKNIINDPNIAILNIHNDNVIISLIAQATINKEIQIINHISYFGKFLDIVKIFIEKLNKIKNSKITK
jgi:hypothetical protein